MNQKLCVCGHPKESHNINGTCSELGYDTICHCDYFVDDSWKFVPSHDVGGKAVPDYWEDQETLERHYGNNPPRHERVMKTNIKIIVNKTIHHPLCPKATKIRFGKSYCICDRIKKEAK